MRMDGVGRAGMVLPLVVAGGVWAQSPKEVPSAPRSYTLAGGPAATVASPEAAEALARKVAASLRADRAGASDPNPAAQVGRHTAAYLAAMVSRDFSEALANLERVRSFQEPAVARQLTGLLSEPLIRTFLAPGGDLHGTYRTHLTKQLAALKYAEAAGPLERMLKQQRETSREGILASVEALGGALPDGTVPEPTALAVLNAALQLHLLLPLREDAIACLEAWFAQHKQDPAPRSPVALNALKARGAYFGQPRPGMTPVPFAPDLLKPVSAWISGITFSPDGTECFLHVGDATYSGAWLYRTSCVNGVWTPLEEPAFVKDFRLTAEPVYRDGGRTLLFTGRKEGDDTNFWTVARQEKGWGVPVAMPAPLNSKANEFRGSFTTDGTFYFGSERDTPGINQVFKATPTPEGRWTVTRLEAPVNARSYDGDPCIAPDGRWIVIYAARPEGLGRVDLYVTFADGKGGWGPLVNLGPRFNSPHDEFGACLSTDGQYVFYTRHEPTGDTLFWVSVAAIDALKPGAAPIR